MSVVPSAAREPNPAIIFDTVNAYQRSAALKAAVELDLFTHIARGNTTAAAISQAIGGSERAVRILCDFLVIGGLLTKEGNQYSPSLEASLFLNRESPHFFGNAVEFLLTPHLISPYLDLTQIVRTGRTTLPGQGTVSPDNPVWVTFAKQMTGMMFPAAMEMAELLAGQDPLRVLDIAAGHGIFGIMIAKHNPNARISALDWANVLAVATENAQKFGVADRVATMPGDAFHLEFGGPYDLVLVTNFFHHFDQPTCEQLMRKILASLAPGGRCVTLEFVPDDNRVTPPAAASFAMMMLGTTASGDAYTFAEYDQRFRNAGFASSEFHRLAKSAESLVISTKAS